MMNLMINGIDAMKDVDGARELAIKAQKAQDNRILVSVSDTGGPDLQGILYHEASGDRHGPVHQPLHRWIAWRALVGCRRHSAPR
jgi:hypothetical protein